MAFYATRPHAASLQQNLGVRLTDPKGCIGPSPRMEAQSARRDLTASRNRKCSVILRTLLGRDVCPIPSGGPESSRCMAFRITTREPSASQFSQPLPFLELRIAHHDPRSSRRRRALVVAFMVIVLRDCAVARRSEASPKRISLDKHSLLSNRIQHSARAFRFGLRGGSNTGCAPPERRVARKQRRTCCRDHARQSE
jgi:hypothetical protein